MNPDRPVKSSDKDKPDYWEVQIRTEDKEIKKEWEALNINVKAVIPDDDKPPFFKAKFRRKVINSHGEEAECPLIVNGNLDVIDPTTIGNGSIGNVQLFQFNYPAGKDYAAGISSVLMKVQLTKHLVYVSNREEFDKTETETVTPEDKPMDNAPEAEDPSKEF